MFITLLTMEKAIVPLYGYKSELSKVVMKKTFLYEI